MMTKITMMMTTIEIETHKKIDLENNDDGDDDSF